MNNKSIDRRTVLRGLGVSVALPMLEAMTPGLAFTQSNAVPALSPKRMAFCYVPNGVNMADWKPRAYGTDFDLPSTLQPLQPLKQDLLVMTGLTCDKARPNGDGPGDHARAMSAFLTGCQARKTAGTNIHVGVSIDQVAAQRIGRATRFPSLEIGCERGRLAGNCDSGYSCAYSHAISWRTPSTPNPKEIDPRAVFDRLFGGNNAQDNARAQSRREEYNRSILDFVREDARRLNQQLGSADQRRMDEYLSSIREVETRITRADREQERPQISRPARPSGIPREYQDHLRIMSDLLALAFQGDRTRVATFIFANEGSNRSYRNINVREGHHSLSHHRRQREKLEKLSRINHFHITQFAYLLTKLKSIREGNGTLLDNCMVLYGSGNSDGNRHNHDDLPILLAGRGGGTITTGRHVRYRRETPLTNLYLSMLDRMGIQGVERHGDSTARLGQLS